MIRPHRLNGLILSFATLSCAFGGPPLGIPPSALSQGESLQAVIDRGGPLVYVPAGNYQAEKTIYLRSNMTLYCEPGAVIEAAAGAFKPVHEPESCLMALVQVENVSIFNCTFKMRKADYGVYKINADGTYDLTPNAAGYVPGEWRHTVYVAGSSNVLLYNVKGQSSGGDGLIVASLNPPSGKIPSRNVRVEKSVFADNFRQGVSLLSCFGDCMVEDCVFTGTKGASPQAGIDIEPEWGDAVEVTVRRCQSIGNRGPAYMVGLFKAVPTDPPSKVIFKDCTWAAVPGDQVHFRLGGVLNHEVPNGYLLPNLPNGTWAQWNDLVWRK